MLFHDCLLMSSQYFDADHRFKCTECDREFVTGAGRDKVRSSYRFVDWVLIQSVSTMMQHTR